MPRSKIIRVKSLNEICVNFVTDNMEFWCEHSTPKLFAMGPKIGSNPLDFLPSLVLDQIRNALYGKCKMKKRFLEHLITPHLTSLDLKLLPKENSSSILLLATIRCPALKSLAFCPNYESYVEFLPEFKNLQVLDISMGLFQLHQEGDECLLILGTYCKQLRELNLASCKRVTDTGIEWLCGGVGCLGVSSKSKKSGQCKAIEKLWINDTKVTKTGVLIALKNLPALKILKHKDTYEVLGEIAGMALQLKPWLLPENIDLFYPLLELDYRSIIYKNGSLAQVLSLCPKLLKLDLEVWRGFKDSDLLSVISLSNLQELGIQDFREITSTGGIFPTLKAIGRNLKKLHFTGIQDVNIVFITEFCPNLLELTLNQLNYTSTWPEEQQGEYVVEQKILKNLQKLKVEGSIREANCISRKILLTLLASPLLREFEVSQCAVFTDDLLLKAAKQHQFKSLEILKISKCHSISPHGINVFRQENSLKKISFYCCKKMNKQYALEWKKQARKQNWEISFSYRSPSLDEKDVSFECPMSEDSDAESWDENVSTDFDEEENEDFDDEENEDFDESEDEDFDESEDEDLSENI